jgi:hypothetical protein
MFSPLSSLLTRVIIPILLSNLFVYVNNKYIYILIKIKYNLPKRNVFFGHLPLRAEGLGLEKKNHKGFYVNRVADVENRTVEFLRNSFTGLHDNLFTRSVNE